MTYEQVINHAIRNGAHISENGLGTILPTAEGLQVADKFADKQAAVRDKLAGATLTNCTRRAVDGELRYYASDTQFAIMSRANVVRWFEIRENGVVYALR